MQSSSPSSFAQQWQQKQQRWYNRPPWEVGPEELRLPRYMKVCGRDERRSLQQQKQREQVPNSANFSLKDLVSSNDEQLDDDDEEEVNDDGSYVDNCVASGSV